VRREDGLKQRRVTAGRDLRYVGGAIQQVLSRLPVFCYRQGGVADKKNEKDPNHSLKMGKRALPRLNWGGCIRSGAGGNPSFMGGGETSNPRRLRVAVTGKREQSFQRRFQLEVKTKASGGLAARGAKMQPEVRIATKTKGNLK